MATLHSLLRIGIGLAAGLALAGCATPTGQAPAGTAPTVARPAKFKPVPVRGVESCSDLDATRGQPTASGGLPSLTLPCLSEPGRVDVASLGGRPTLVNLWATWCGPCREEMPVLQEAYEKSAGDVQFVGVDSKDDPEAAAEFLGEVKATYPQLVDTDGALLAHTRVPGLPVTLLIDEHGKEIARHIGPLNAQDLADLLDEA